MNPDEIDVMKLTPEDYLKMYDRCKELERDNILQREHILELERVNSELSGTIRRMHGGCERAVELRKLLDELFDIGRDEVIPDDEIRKRMQNLQNELAQLRKENCRVYKQCNQLADEKKQQAAYILELRDELVRLRVAANKSAERVKVLTNSISQLQNDSLMKELARRQEALLQVVDNDADAYQQNVLKYAPDHHDYLLNVIYAAMGMCGEAGEASELVKKYAYHGHAIDTEHLARELGDVLWYVSYMAHLFGYPLGKIMAMNQEKLAKRYPDGKFDEERSRNREEGDI